MTIDPRIIGIGAAVLAVVIFFYMPVSKHRVNQTLVAILLAILVFVACLSLLPPEIAVPAAAIISLVVILARLAIGTVRSALYHNVTRYTRRDYWQRRVGQSILGSNRRRR